MPGSGFVRNGAIWGLGIRIRLGVRDSGLGVRGWRFGGLPFLLEAEEVLEGAMVGAVEGVDADLEAVEVFRDLGVGGGERGVELIERQETAIFEEGEAILP